ncbi:MAG: holo-ACP synthase [Dehalococcoidia bacterium]|nr:holo-ACP synthase [Dehalococcoidia bacterium]MDH4300180.1 holo-ACP synthase [Dehalococcoidia bacterium]MDH4366945.1 holo-ACP synthase [Dehalococcoidia bacterium]
MASVGVDIVEIKRIESAVNRGRERFLTRVYAETELKTCQDRLSSLASRFAAKEAVMKVLGEGGTGIAWREIEIITGDDGRPSVRLHGQALNKATRLDLKEVCVSLSDTKEYAIAVAIGI